MGTKNLSIKEWNDMVTRMQTLQSNVTAKLEEHTTQLDGLQKQGAQATSSSNRVMGPSRPETIKFKVDIPVFTGLDGDMDYQMWADTMQVLLAGAHLVHTIDPKDTTATPEEHSMALAGPVP